MSVAESSRAQTNLEHKSLFKVQKQEVTEMLMNCPLWITLSKTQILLNVKLSCILSRIMKLPREIDHIAQK